MPACLTPFILKQKINDSMLVPCGHCPNCLKKRVSEWSFRLMQEAKISSSAFFLTFTYDNKNLPRSNNNFPTLSRPTIDVRTGKSVQSDLQGFFKMLRKKQSGISPSIRYYAVGEYGSKTYRPHYHAIVFNMELETFIGKDELLEIEYFGYDSKRQIDSLVWKKGKVSVGTVDERSCGYALKYVTKEPIIGLHERDDRAKEFAVMSKGLGACYLTDEMKAWHYALPYERMYCNIEDGKKVSMCRYYKNKLYSDDLRKEIGLQSRSKMIERQLQEYKALTPEQRENVLRSYNDRVQHAFNQMYQASLINREQNF